MPIRFLSNNRPTKGTNNNDSENMIEFATKLINRAHSLRKKGTILNERIAILHLDHATELLMKAYLINEGYVINKFRQNIYREGLKKHASIEYYLDDDKTIDFPEALEVVSNNINLTPRTKDIINKFHKLRNEIQHRALEIPLDKSEKIVEFIPQLKELYMNMFPNEWTLGENVQTGELVTLYHRRIML